MARRVPDQNQNPQTPEAQPSAEGIPGGSAGIIPDAAATITDPAQASAHAEIPEDAPTIEVKKYRVENDAPAGKTGFPVLLDGCLSHLPKGKIVSENAYDIAKLESQGVVLKQV
jgi:hypothetical protein